MPPRLLMPAALLAILLATPIAHAENPEFQLTIRNHRFEPETLQVPANVKLKLQVRNLDPTPEEFESYELNREKVIPGKSTGTIFIGPLSPGTYPFFGDFHQKTAQGRIIAR